MEKKTGVCRTQVIAQGFKVRVFKLCDIVTTNRSNGVSVSLVFQPRDQISNKAKHLTLVLQKENLGIPRVIDEDMTLMHTTMICEWNGVEEVQQGCPSRGGGGTRLIWFESPRWRPKVIQVLAQFGVQEQHTLKTTPRSHTESVLDVLYMVRSIIS
jgi:hypothetical protein